jgi:hypothetical protein
LRGEKEVLLREEKEGTNAEAAEEPQSSRRDCGDYIGEVGWAKMWRDGRVVAGGFYGTGKQERIFGDGCGCGCDGVGG